MSVPDDWMPPVNRSTGCDELAARQHGVVSREQALAAGLTKRSIHIRVASGRWDRLHRGVYRALPLPPSWHQRLMAAVLHGGPSAVASHRSAAALWSLDGVGTPPIEISVKSGLKMTGAIVHRRRPTDDPRVVVRDGIPATTIERTLVDLAAVMAPARVGRALDEALRRGDTTLLLLREEIPSSGRSGRGTLRRLLEERDDRDAQVESRLEQMMLQLLRRAGIPLPLPQHRVVEDGVPIARIDFAYPAYRLGIEVDGYRWHSGVQRWREDLRRENRLKLLGWTLLRFSWADVEERPEQVVSQIRAGLETLGQGSPRRLPTG